ncbi:MAG: T9SS type A sorting domain-containing protein [Saprospiraceae bacterium]
MNPRAYSLSFALLVALLCCSNYASAQTPFHTVAPCAMASVNNSLVTILPYSELQKPGTQTVTLSPNGLVQVQGLAFDRYSVFDELGEMWVAGPGTSTQIDLGHLPAGVYYLHLSSKAGEVVSKMLKGSNKDR